MDIISEDLNFRDLAGVLLQMGDELSGPYLPDTDLTFHTTRDNKLIVVTESYGGYTIFVSIINLPEHLIVVDSVSSNFAVGPS